MISQHPEFTFDDILLLPGLSNFNILEEHCKVNIKTKISRNIEIDIPIVSSPMPGVTEDEMAIAIGKLGGLGFIHHFQSLERQIEQIKRVKKEKIKVAACINDISPDFIGRAEKLVKAGADLISLETAHAHNNTTINLIKQFKKKFPKTDLSVSLIVTAKAAEDIIKAGADSIRVGIGGGSHCTTRLVTGIGRPQLSALADCYKIAKKYKIPMISDTGIKYAGDITKAIAFGADAVMIGGLFTGTDQAPGKIIKNKGKKYKMTWGMCTDTAMQQKQFFSRAFTSTKQLAIKILKHPRSTMKEIFQTLISFKNQENKLFEEGVEKMVTYKGDVKNVFCDLKNGLIRSMWYLGAKNLKDIKKDSKVVFVSGNTYLENIPRI